jgi:hypothetical protein
MSETADELIAGMERGGQCGAPLSFLSAPMQEVQMWYISGLAEIYLDLVDPGLVRKRR